jgi:hypothetical protein
LEYRTEKTAEQTAAFHDSGAGLDDWIENVARTLAMFGRAFDRVKSSRAWSKYVSLPLTELSGPVSRQLHRLLEFGLGENLPWM